MTCYLKQIKCFIIFVNLFALVFCAKGQTEYAAFTHRTTDDGLSNTTINCIIQDKDGFMWVGTDDGLNRYDGYDFKKFKKKCW